MYIQIAILIISLIVTYAMTPKPATPKAAAIDDFDFPQFDEGTAQAVIFGDCWSTDWMVLGIGNYRTSEIKR